MSFDLVSTSSDSLPPPPPPPPPPPVLHQSPPSPSSSPAKKRKNNDEKQKNKSKKRKKKVTTSVKFSMEELKLVFDTLDHSGNGYFGLTDLISCVIELESQLNDQTLLQEMITKANPNGLVDFASFVAMMQSFMNE